MPHASHQRIKNVICFWGMLGAELHLSGNALFDDLNNGPLILTTGPFLYREMAVPSPQVFNTWLCNNQWMIYCFESCVLH
jgi:hypothetical protein